MITRRLMFWGFGVLPVIVQCTPINDRTLVDEENGQSGKVGAVSDGGVGAESSSQHRSGTGFPATGDEALGGAPSAIGGNGSRAGSGGALASSGAATGGNSAAGGGASAGSGGVIHEPESACPPGVLGHCAIGTTYPSYDGYTLALVEDFPAPIDLDHDPIFTWSDGSPSDGQTGFRKEQITFADGKMRLTAEAPAGCTAKTTNAACVAPRIAYAEALAPNSTATVNAMGVWSGELRSRYNNYRYGRYEVKYAAPIANPGQEATDDQSGNYLSTMFVFRSPRNVVWNEIDVELSPWHHDQTCGNLVNANGATGYPAGYASPFQVAGPAGYSIVQEHVYAFNWTPTQIEWFVDGQSIHTFSGTANVLIPTLSAKIMMNLWVFSGSTFGDGANNKYPFFASYDYFRFYKLNTETKYPCSPTPACLEAADKTASAQNNPDEVSYGQ